MTFLAEHIVAKLLDEKPRINEAASSYRIKVGRTYWFEYHCEESHTSCDANVWYHSHQKARILRMTQQGFGVTEQERAENGQAAHYQISFADGFQTEAGEDELMSDRSEFCRPGPVPRVSEVESEDAAKERLLRLPDYDLILLEAGEDEVKAVLLTGSPDYPFRLKWSENDGVWKVTVHGLRVGQVSQNFTELKRGRFRRVYAVSAIWEAPDPVSEELFKRVFTTKRAAAQAIVHTVRYTIPARLAERQKEFAELLAKNPHWFRKRP